MWERMWDPLNFYSRVPESQNFGFGKHLGSCLVQAFSWKGGCLEKVAQGLVCLEASLGMRTLEPLWATNSCVQCQSCLIKELNCLRKMGRNLHSIYKKKIVVKMILEITKTWVLIPLKAFCKQTWVFWGCAVTKRFGGIIVVTFTSCY